MSFVAEACFEDAPRASLGRADGVLVVAAWLGAAAGGRTLGFEEPTGLADACFEADAFDAAATEGFFVEAFFSLARALGAALEGAFFGGAFFAAGFLVPAARGGLFTVRSAFRAGLDAFATDFFALLALVACLVRFAAIVTVVDVTGSLHRSGGAAQNRPR